MRNPPAPAARRTAVRRVGLLLLLLALLGLLVVLGRHRTSTGRAGSADAGDPTPDRPARATPSEGGGLAAPAADALHVWLRDLAETRFVHSVPGNPFAEVWPAAGDPGWDAAWWDDLRTPEALRSLSGPGTPFKNRRGAQVLALAHDEGFGSGAAPATPEEALVDLYTTWVEAEVGYEQDWRAFEAEHLPDGLRRSDLDRADLLALMALPGKPVQEVGALQAAAEQALAAWPDHPIADHARLAQLRAARPYGHGREGWDPEVIGDLLHGIRTPALRVQGALLVTELREVTPELLDQVFAVEPSDTRDALRLASWGVARSVAAEDWARAAAWADRTRPAVDGVCALDSGSAAVPCEHARYQLRETTSRLVALGLQAPVTWQEALTAAAWRCHLAAPAEPGTSRTHASWTGERWAFEPWDTASPVTTCLDGLGRAEVVPGSPLRVRLTVETDR